ncbi:MAG TPA: glycosyltransferase family 4 protein [Streptosporangiaceae bacterium]|nr:glycosyltransferase family 4 protein [Streptosporangiaceae bacterium]
MTELVLGLARHAETERRHPGASPGTHLLFSSLEASLARKCALRLLPADCYGGAVAHAARAAQDLLSEVDALILSLPPRPSDFGALALVRQMLGRRIPFVYLPLGEFPWGARFYRHLHHYLSPGDLVCFSSTADRAVYERLVASSPAQVSVLPFGIDPSPYQRASAQRSATRHSLRIADDEVVFVIHGRIEMEKNVHAAVALLSQLARGGHRCRLWLAGPSPGAPALPWGPRPLSALPRAGYWEVLAESLHSADPGLVWWWGSGSREQVAQVVGAADIGLNLTLARGENFGFATVEAMAAGLPVIGTDWGGLKDTIEHGVTGYRVPTVVTGAGAALDHYSLLYWAERLGGDPALRRRMGAAAAARVQDRYLVDQCTDALLDEVRDLLHGMGGSRAHRWTALGQRLFERYSVRIDASPGVLPRPLPPARPCDNDIIRAVLRPYGTRDQDIEPDPGSVFMFASVLLRSGPGEVRSADPAYPVSLDLGPAEAAVCALLQARGHLTYEHLTTAAGLPPGEVAAALRCLLAAGVVLQSPGGTTRHQHEEEKSTCGSWE